MQGYNAFTVNFRAYPQGAIYHSLQSPLFALLSPPLYTRGDLVPQYRLPCVQGAGQTVRFGLRDCSSSTYLPFRHAALPRGCVFVLRTALLPHHSSRRRRRLTTRQSRSPLLTPPQAAYHAAKLLITYHVARSATPHAAAGGLSRGGAAHHSSRRRRRLTTRQSRSPLLTPPQAAYHAAKLLITYHVARSATPHAAAGGS